MCFSTFYLNISAQRPTQHFIATLISKSRRSLAVTFERRALLLQTTGEDF